MVNARMHARMQRHTHVMATRRPLASLSCHLMHMHMHHMQCARDNFTHAAQLRLLLIDATDLLLERQPCKAAQANARCSARRIASIGANEPNVT